MERGHEEREGSLARLLLIDGNNIFYRALHGLRNSLLMTTKGEETWAVVGTVNAIAAVVKEWQPTHLLVAFDGGPSRYRRELYADYKASRPKSDGEEKERSIEQLRKTLDILSLLGVFLHQEPEVEADDIIATCVKRWSREFDDVIIVSGDKDFLQLVDENVRVVQPSLGGKTSKARKEWTVQTVIERYGLPPVRLIEAWAMVGDKVDNVPGAPGIGEKTALKLIEKYGSLSMVVLSGEKKIAGHEGEILLSMKLIELDGSLARCGFDLDQIRWRPVAPHDSSANEVVSLLEAWEMRGILRRWHEGYLWMDVAS